MYYLNQKNPHGGAVGKNIALDFSISLNPLGMPPAAREAAREAAGAAERYPDPCCRELVEAIAAREAVPGSSVLCGNGASELIWSYCAALRPARAILPVPTFSEYAAALIRYGCQVDGYPLRQADGFALSEEFPALLERERPDAVFLCNPNNPTGRLIPLSLLERILQVCRKRGIRLFLDECFLELAEDGESLRGRMKEYPGLFILRAFTKTYAMAGLRLGYCLSADRALLQRMSAITPPWNVSGPAQAAGLAALGDADFLARSRETIRRERVWLKAALEILEYQVFPSEANFLLFHGPAGLRAALNEHGIELRDCANFSGLGPGWYRAAVRRREENEKLVEALRTVNTELRANTLRNLFHSKA